MAPSSASWGPSASIGENKQTGIEVVGPYISEALIATAVGIGVAVVALMLFNFFQARLGRINIELRLLTEEFVEVLTDSTVIPSKDSPEPSDDDDEPDVR